MSPRKKKAAKPKPIDLKLTLENFGPLRKAEIDLKPLTIFIGPNNSGKTYTATMIYSLLQSIDRADLRPSGQSRSYKNWDSDAKAILSASNHFMRLYENALPSELSEGTVAELAQVFGKPLGRELIKEIHRCWPPAGGQLNRAGTKHYQLGVHSEPLSFTYEQHSKSLRIRRPEGPVKLPERTEKYFGALTRRPRSAHMERYFDLAEIGSPVLFSTFDRAAYYIPASRTGIVRTYGMMIDRAIERFEWSDHAQPAGHLAGVDIDLTRYLTNLPQAPGPFADLAAEMASELIKGDIVVMWTDKNLPPDISIKFGECRISMDRASSGVCDMVPVLLFTSFLVRRGDLLIIDEPEAHLHPGAIRILAKYMVKLVREGVNLILATHSDYLLGQINNYILAGRLRHEGVSKGRKEDSEVYLDREKVACYLFKAGATKEDGFSTEELTAEEDGFSEDEFTKVAREMYDQSVMMRRQLIPEKRLVDILES